MNHLERRRFTAPTRGKHKLATARVQEHSIGEKNVIKEYVIYRY